MGSDSLWSTLQRLVSLFGPLLTVILVGMVIASILYALYLVLAFGHEAGRMFIPMVKHVLLKLWEELGRDSPAIRVEIAFTIVYFLMLFLAFGALLLHGLVIWHANLNETFFKSIIISCALVIAVLCAVSVRLSSRLD